MYSRLVFTYFSHSLIALPPLFSPPQKSETLPLPMTTPCSSTIQLETENRSTLQGA